MPELVLIAVVLGCLAAFMAIPATLSFVVLNRIPVAHRKLAPGLAFLLLIPFFALVWQFFVYPRIADSLQSYFGDRPDRPDGDFGGRLALWCCLCSVMSFIPFLGFVAGIAALVLLVLFFVTVLDLSKRIPKPSAP